MSSGLASLGNYLGISHTMLAFHTYSKSMVSLRVWCVFPERNIIPCQAPQRSRLLFFCLPGGQLEFAWSQPVVFGEQKGRVTGGGGSSKVMASSKKQKNPTSPWPSLSLQDSYAILLMGAKSVLKIEVWQLAGSRINLPQSMFNIVELTFHRHHQRWVLFGDTQMPLKNAFFKGSWHLKARMGALKIPRTKRFSEPCFTEARNSAFAILPRLGLGETDDPLDSFWVVLSDIYFQKSRPLLGKKSILDNPS